LLNSETVAFQLDTSEQGYSQTLPHRLGLRTAEGSTNHDRLWCASSSRWL